MDHFAIRRASLSGRNKEIKALLISGQGLKAYHFIFDKREATSSEVASHFNLSPQHASTMLHKLYKQMYLRRSERAQESGGYEWVYYP